MMLIVFLSLVLPAAAATCLINGTAPINRKLLVNPNTGESYPVGVWVAQWAAAEATSYMVGILIEEMLGFNVTYSFGPGTPDGYYAIAGCSDPNNKSHRGCVEGQVSYQHVFTEAWLAGYESTWNAVQKFQNAPKALTSMGYSGFISTYFTQRELDTAYATEGLALDFWTAFDSTWNQPWNYFDNPSVVNRSEILPCSQSNFYEDNIMRQYLTWSGDTAGVITQPDGSLIGNCQDGYFWQAPACRGNIANCIVYFTGGKGYSLTETMQKAAKWNMPLAVGIGATWSDFVSLPSKHKSLFYWWVPDPTFLEMDPVKSAFPDYDKQAWANGDQTTASSSMPIHKVVSRDLSSLSPRLEMFVDNFIIDMGSLNKILKDQISSGDDWKSVACGWLQNNQETWQKWLPDESTCFPTLGMYNTITDEFVPDRSNKDGLVCRACPSGTYSVQISDDDGPTYICQACPPGTSQSSGASLACEPCAKGLFQDQPGQLRCKRCEVGTYQDEEGSPTCKQCPLNSRTLALGSVEFGDCGCEENYINVGSEGNLTCAVCQVGLSCPFMGTEKSLENGFHPLGEGYTPKVLKGYYSKKDSPLEVYKCGRVFQCPGGLPDTCAGGLTGTPCAECPPGQTYSDGCQECELWRQFAWVFSAFFGFFILTMSYYLMTSKVTAKASVLFTTTCAFGMLVSLLQSIGIIGGMTVEFPINIKGIFSFMSIFVLDLESFGFACVAGANTPLRYIVSVILFPIAVGWLALNFGVSKLVPRHAWDSTKVLSCMGQVLQVAFSTMSAVALAPFMCYTHPNTQLSLLKYPNILCGSDDHALMLAGGSLLLVIGVFGFLAVCTYAAFRVPSWSATEQHKYVRCFRFLVFRFRLDSWWFGVPLLMRGPLISLPIVFATDYAGIQTVWVTVILLSFLACQALAWPWKVPLLNALDCWMSFCIMVLVAGSALYLEPVEEEGVTAAFVSAFSTGVMVLIFSSIGLMILMALSGLVRRAALGGGEEYAFINLGRTPDSEQVSVKLKVRRTRINRRTLKSPTPWSLAKGCNSPVTATAAPSAAAVEEMAELLGQMELPELEKALDTLAVFDTRRITSFMTMLSAEVLYEQADFKYGTRVSSQSFSQIPVKK